MCPNSKSQDCLLYILAEVLVFMFRFLPILSICIWSEVEVGFFFFTWLSRCSRIIIEKTSLSTLRCLSIFVNSICCRICVGLLLDFLCCPTDQYFFYLYVNITWFDYDSLIMSLDNRYGKFLTSLFISMLFWLV